MSKEHLPLHPGTESQLALKARIEALRRDLDEVDLRTVAFETTLRSHIARELVEEQELSVLYKKQKRAKKEKRLEQKRRGKNYREPCTPQAPPRKRTDADPDIRSLEEQRELKRLYRETMLQVHPDKFSLSGGDVDLATETAATLIEIYESGDLEKLRSYQAHIFSGNASIEVSGASATASATSGRPGGTDSYLQSEVERLEQELAAARAKHTYVVLTEYEDPLSFLDELKEYYEDRLSKLRRRTRTT